MKHRLFFITLCCMFIGCLPSSTYHELEIIESIIDERPDSAFAILDAMSYPRREKDAMVYQLLHIQAKVKLFKQVSSDSVLDRCIAYFLKEKDERRLAASYYYKYGVLYLLGKKEEAMTYLKKAEMTADKLGDMRMKTKIYMSLAEMNIQSSNVKKALGYAKRYMECSEQLRDSGQMCRSYYDLAKCYKYLYIKDSSFFYRKKCLQLADKDTTNRVYYYSFYAECLLDSGMNDEAEIWINKAIKYKQLPSLYEMSGRIAKDRGDTISARLYWEKEISFNENRLSYRAYMFLMKMALQRKDYQLAIKMKEKADSMLYAYSDQARTIQLAEIQQKYDKTLAEKELVDNQRHWLMAAVIVLLLLMLLLAVIAFYVNKTRQYRGVVDENVRQINEVRQKISLLESAEQGYSKEIDRLNAELRQRKEIILGKLSSGKEVYEAFNHKESYPHFTKEKEQDFVDYYAFMYYEDFETICRPYKSLTLRHTTYLILQYMNLSDKDIEKLLNVTDTTVRNYRFRIKNS